MADLKFYLTSSEPNITQTAPSQSLGGFPSISEYSANALFADGMNDQTDMMILTSTLSNPYAVLSDAELMKVVSTETLGAYGEQILTVTRGDFGTDPEFHITGDSAYAQTKNSLFNGSFSADGKQHRCIAVQNTSSNVMQNVQAYIKSAGTNPLSVVQLAIEIPIDNVFYGTTAKGTR
jgi:hypothetical protein